jgi:hypothetical protein
LDRNPYVILGIPFGTPRAAANAAFARKAQALKRDGGDLDRMTDLTWALQRISVAITEPATAMELYRIPAGPAFQTGGDGAPAELRQVAAREYLRYLVTVRAAKVPLPPP